ncbi:hypothetical protein EJ02DRAFT_455551 [Clathrospora elynae]|uniref:Secreted protein n=1 Tax=Clathrospora elynae TaxID=706981 RepID=A0A6A5SMZ1_9PLEO|nr:hypothetical protein EJ02DRAFT_455551 [Clathrospora elynae]
MARLAKVAVVRGFLVTMHVLASWQTCCLEVVVYAGPGYRHPTLGTRPDAGERCRVPCLSSRDERSHLISSCDWRAGDARYTGGVSVGTSAARTISEELGWETKRVTQ